MDTGLRAWASQIKTETLALYFAVRDPSTPWYARALGIGIIAYALSPIDLIPDFIPVLGYLDDVLIVPAGLWAVRRMIPPNVLESARERARGSQAHQSRTAAAIIIGIWIVALVISGLAIWRLTR